MTFEILSSIKSHIIRWPRHLLMAGGFCLLVACGGGGGGSAASSTYTAASVPVPRLVRTDGDAAINPGFEATFVVVFSYGTGKLIADDGTPERSVISGQSITVQPTVKTKYTLTVSYQNPETVRPDPRKVTADLTIYVNTLADIFPKPADIILTPDFSTVSRPGTVNLTLTYPTPAGLDVVSTEILVNGVLDTSFTGIIKSGQKKNYTNLLKDTYYTLKVTYRDTRNALNPIETIPSLLSPNIVVTGAGTFGQAPDMNIARSDFSATFIANKGQVLVCGGVSQTGTILSSCEVYDPFFRTWTLVPTNMSSPRRGHAATLLYGGSNVLISGGYTTGALTASKTSDIYDSASKSFVAGPTLIEARSGHSSVLLSNQKVLIFGGAVSSGNGTAAELVTFDAKGKATTAATGSLNAPRQDHTVTSLPTGEVLVTGRTDGGTPTYVDGKLVNSKTFEIYDETAATWTLGSVPMNVGRSNHAASLLPYDQTTRSPLQILISGGSGIAASGTAEVLKRVINTSGGVTTVTWTTSTSAIPMLKPRSFHTSTTLSSGDVLLIGGKGPDVFSTDLDTTDTYLSNATTAKFDDLNTQKTLNYARYMHKSILLSNDSVLVIGNYFKDQGKADTIAELWSPPAP